MNSDSLPSLDASDKRRWLVLAGLAAVPFVLPVGVLGLRGVWPRTLRASFSTAILVGAVSLLGLSASGVTRRRRTRPQRAQRSNGSSQRWKLPVHGPLLPEEFAASAASGH